MRPMAKNKLSQNYKTKLPKYIDYYLKLIKTSYLALKFYPNIDLYQPIFYYLLIDIYEHLTFIIITNLRILLSSNAPSAEQGHTRNCTFLHFFLLLPR